MRPLVDVHRPTLLRRVRFTTKIMSAMAYTALLVSWHLVVSANGITATLSPGWPDPRLLPVGLLATRVGEASHPGPAAAGKEFLASVQPVTTRPATCKGCRLPFLFTDARVCPTPHRSKSAWTHFECRREPWRTDISLRADKPGDAAATAQFQELVRKLAAEQSTAPVIDSTTDADRELEVLALPADEDSLPNASWISSLSFDDILSLVGDTYVQVPRRLEQAFADAVRPALLLTAAAAGDNASRTLGWKALLLLPWLLLRVPKDNAEQL